MRGALEKLTVKGFKSIKNLNEFKLGDLNVIIGANGAGKSNFVQIFRMLVAMTQKNFSKFILERGGADTFLFEGPKVTSKIEMGFDFTSHCSNATGPNSYRFELTPTADENFLIAEERKYVTTEWRSYGSPSKESRLYDERNEKSWDGQWNGVGHFVFESISNWMVYHFHDTSSSSPMRRSEIVEDYYKLMWFSGSNQ
jgi:predicted ATPase